MSTDKEQKPIAETLHAQNPDGMFKSPVVRYREPTTEETQTRQSLRKEIHERFPEVAEQLRIHSR